MTTIKSIAFTISVRLRSATVSALTWYFARTQIPRSFEKITQLLNAGRSVTVIAQAHSVIFEALVNSLARRCGVNFVGSPLNPGRDPAHPNQGSLSICSLHDHATLQELISEDSERAFTTLNLFHLRGPMRATPSYRMGVFRQLGVLLDARFLFITFGDPLSLTERTLRTQHNRPLEGLTRSLKLDFYRNLRVIRGTPFQSMERQLRAVLGGKEVERELRIIASRGAPRDAKSAKLTAAGPNTSSDSAPATPAQAAAVSHYRKLAEKEFYTVAANPRRFLYGIVAPLCHLVLNRLFKGVVIEGVEQIENSIRDKAVVLVPMHRSHLDYILLSTQLYLKNLNPPLVAAGINLAFWPCGGIFRSLGAYFVRRDSRHDRIHNMVLRRYVRYLTRRGHLQKFYIEGGRSRSGRMRPPKVGLLSIMLDAWSRGEQQEICFVPVSITYENVVEEGAYGHENTGAKKVKESLVSLIKIRSIFKKKYGEVYVKFGTPLTPGGVLEEANSKFELKKLVHTFAFELSRRIRDQSQASLTSLAYAALLCAPRYGLSEEQLADSISDLARIISTLQPAKPLTGEITPSLAAYLAGNRGWIEDLVGSGTVTRGEALGYTIYSIPGTKRYTADFYRNSVIHLFFEASLFALLQLRYGSIKIEQSESLRQLLEHDLLLEETEKFRSNLKLCAETLTRAGILDFDSQSQSYTFRSTQGGLFIPNMLLATLESYLWTYENVAALKLEQQTDLDTFVNHLQESFKRGVYLGSVSRTEAGARVSLTTALESLALRKIIVFESEEGKRRSFIVARTVKDDLVELRAFVAAAVDWINDSLARGAPIFGGEISSSSSEVSEKNPRPA